MLKANLSMRTPSDRGYLRAFSSKVKIPQSNNVGGYIRKYQREGYKVASNVDPLGLYNPASKRKALLQEFELDHWQLSELESLDHFPLDYRVTS